MRCRVRRATAPRTEAFLLPPDPPAGPGLVVPEGAEPACERGLQRGRLRHHLIVPEANAREAAVVDGVRAFPVRNLSQVIELLNGKEPWIPLAVDRDQLLAQQSIYDVDFKDVKGQYQAKRALEVAVAGGHNIIIMCAVKTSRY